MFESFADDVLKAEVTIRGNHLKNNSGLALVTGIREDSDRSGKKAVMDLLILKVDPNASPDTNYVGEKVAKQYRFQDGSADKRAAILANFKRDLCVLSGINPKTMTADQFKTFAAAAAKGSYNGLIIRFDPYGATTKAGEGRVYHNLSLVQGKNTPAEVVKRAEALAKGAGPETFL